MLPTQTITSSQITPRHYQVTGVDYLTTKRVKLNIEDMFPTLCRSLLSDAPGAGKTPQSCWAATRLSQINESILIICPAFLVNQWFDAIAELYPNDSIVSLEGPKARREKDAQKDAKWYIVGVQSLRKQDTFDMVTSLMQRQRINVTIIDESHYVKNGEAIQSKRVRQLTTPTNCNHVILLTATPITKEADDLYHQLRIIDPITFHSMSAYLNKYCYFQWMSWGATNVTLRKTAHAELEAQYTTTETGVKQLDLQSGYILGRTYQDIGLELPPIIPPANKAVVHVTLDKSRRKTYNDIKWAWFSTLQEGETLSARSAMEVMHLLRRITNSPEKSLELCNYMEDDPGPYVVACFYKHSAQELAKVISLKYPDKNPIVITGAVPVDERHHLAKSATSPNDVIIATIPSLTEGIDLSHANTVYFYEEDYTPGKMYQFLSRVRRHRDNANITVTIQDNHLHIDEDPNERPVICRYFNAQDTIDERIHAVQSLRSVNIRDLVKVELSQ